MKKTTARKPKSRSRPAALDLNAPVTLDHLRALFGPAPQPVDPRLGPAQLWHFSHSQPGLPGIVSVVVSAPNISEARGVAYLLGEKFTANCIGLLKAGSPAQVTKPAA